jgi:beta-glucoside operon transcriptional antiterminator
MDDEMLTMLKKKFALSYNVSQKVAKLLAKNHGITLPEQELGYITIHIERIRNR